MGYFRLLLLIIIYGFIAIGDFVSRVIYSTASFSNKLWDDYLRKARSTKSFSGKKTLYKSRFSFFSSIFFQINLKKILNTILSTFEFIGRESWMFFIFVLTGIWRAVVKVQKIFYFMRRRKKGQHEVKQVAFRVKALYFLIGSFFSFIFFFLPILFFIFISELPHPSQLSTGAIPKTTKIYDRHGELLYEIFVSQNRTPVPLSSVPVHLVEATIAIEDKDFYSHPGFDVRGMSRAFYENTTTDNLQGGSTITQQLIKSALLTPEPTISRKIKEVALAFWAERIYNKDQILEMYFNYVPYGGTAWGISAAAETYFDKEVSQLTLAESAFLAGLPRAPSIYSPFVGDGTSWRARQRAVLDAMVREGYINKREAQEAKGENLVFATNKTKLVAPHFVMYVKDLLIDKYGVGAVERGGLQVKTTLDMSLQREAEKIVTAEIEKSENLRISNGAALVTDPTSGDVLAMVGSRDYYDVENDGNVNVVRMRRQPGSTIKLVTYALALESGYTEVTLLNDTPLSIEQEGSSPYKPVNYDGQFHGRVPLRNALANSYNIPAVRIAQDLGADAIVELGTRLGISSWASLEEYGLSITLGGSEVTMLDLATAYGTVANEGERIDIDPILEIQDSGGEVIYQKQLKSEKVLSSGAAFILSDILADNKARSTEFGNNSPLHIPPHRVSVKTGTTDEKRDNWTIGYSSNRLVAVWVGNNDNTPMSPQLTSGLSGAAPIWNKIMSSLLTSDKGPVEVPSDVVVKECFGKKLYLLAGTERNVRCSASKVSTLQPVRVQ